MFLKKKKKLLVGFIAKLMVLVITLSSVSMSVPSVAEAASKPEISKNSKSVLIGNRYNLNIKNKIKGSTYKWKSSNEDVATVNNRGFVTGISKGKAVITCTIKTPKKDYRVKCDVTIRQPAEEFEINNKVSILNVGQKYNLNRSLYPESSNDLTSWSSSDESIATPNSRGKFTALKEGTVVIKGTTLSKKSDDVTIRVVDEAGIVTTQEELDEFIGSGVGLITVKTDEEATFSIPEGDYGKQTLVVDAPKGEITNKGVFKAIEIKNISPNTWYEQAIGNELNVSARNSRIVVDNNATVSIVSNSSNLNIVNNGVISGLTLNSSGSVNIEGSSTTPVPITANTANAEITTSVPVNMICNQRITLNILPGAEASTVEVASEEFIPNVIGVGNITVIIGTGENATTRTIEATPANNSSSGGSSGHYHPSPSPTPNPEAEVNTGEISGRVTAVSVVTGSAIEVVTGSAIEVVTGSAIVAMPGVNVRILKYDGTTVNAALESIFTNPNTIVTITDENGLYSVDELDEGSYVVVMGKSGYKVLIQQTTIVPGASTVLNGLLIPLDEDESIVNGYASGKIINALNGQQVDSSLEFTLKVYSRNEAGLGALVLTEVVSGGKYTIQLPEGYYTVELTDNREAVDGVTYAKAISNLVVLGGSTYEDQDIVLSTLKTAGQATFVLTWGEEPWDLDSHLIGPVEEYEKYHIYYASLRYPRDVDHGDLENLDLRLDWDDIDSYGPETVTVYSPVQGGVYTYYVYNYSGNYDSTLANSGAKVVVTTATETMSFEVPAGGEERSWVVCSFDSDTGKITPINELVDNDFSNTIEGLVEG